MIVLICGNENKNVLAERLVDEISKNSSVELITEKDISDTAAIESKIKSIHLVCVLSDVTAYTNIDHDILIYLDDNKDSVPVDDYDFKLPQNADINKWVNTLADLIYILE